MRANSKSESLLFYFYRWWRLSSNTQFSKREFTFVPALCGHGVFCARLAESLKCGGLLFLGKYFTIFVGNKF